MIPAWISFLDALIAVALVAAGIVGAHFYLAAPFFAFQMFAFGFLLAIVGFFVGLVGLLRTSKPPRRVARPRAMIGTILSLVIAAPIVGLAISGAKHPINDITTDFDNSPEFVHAEQLAPNQGREMKYNKAQFAAKQQASEGAIAPMTTTDSPDAAFGRVKVIAAGIPDWQITYADPGTRIIEGVATSSLFHFQDDFVIQVRQAPDGKGSLVEMRSKSRDGIGDFGANATRIRDFFARMAADEQKTAAAPS